MTCVYCEHPLDCIHCRTNFSPKGQGEYLALSRPEIPLYCHECGQVLICYWCQMPYDGKGDEDENT